MNEIAKWLSTQTEKHMVLGYGSLLSKDSRERYSNIFTKGIPVTVSGFERAWVTRSIHEQQTYVGAVANAHSQLNAQLIPTQINPALQEREKDYRFVEVSPKSLSFQLHQGEVTDALNERFSQFTFWICETLACEPASEAFPVNQTYIDTCMAGCLEHGGIKEAERFVMHTSLWEHPRVNDRTQPKYPRAAKVNNETIERIDRILAKR
ncbi:gamma-glutamylcyclotransferase [Alteromonas sp. BL110]|uniref:gamma-glutamylcyclotransferase n=1 Tax=Alteromonas sp. BL110 TaxID=1714845 RepID=UPI000E556F2B|nr:gamma-glutamylcyclotransferase [Alteromonas sp. BL110]AXT37998.1 gamma-glutamylcyclotransferase [Alteromonas sp. BL110]RKM80738.1 gamma-glutamylcyclotransferase [Alteromonas sp. BL110]